MAKQLKIIYLNNSAFGKDWQWHCYGKTKYFDKFLVQPSFSTDNFGLDKPIGTLILSFFNTNILLYLKTDLTSADFFFLRRFTTFKPYKCRFHFTSTFVCSCRNRFSTETAATGVQVDSRKSKFPLFRDFLCISAQTFSKLKFSKKILSDNDISL